jgi:Cys-tRNA synthase (O-phospho-L-seryl-tRNA:Cys-tRNA synthase)
LQEEVTNPVAKGVVDLSEAVEIHYEHSEGFALSRFGGDGLLQVIVKTPPTSKFY